MTGAVVARRYARALFSLEKGKGSDELAVSAQGLTALAELILGSPDLDRVVKSPLFSGDEKKGVLATLADKLNLPATVRDFCSLLADKGRLASLPSIATEFARLLDKETGVTRGHVVTALALDEERQKKILSQLEKKAGRKLALTFDVDPSILGGLTLTIGDKVLDASLKAQLSLLKDTITRG